MTGVAPGLQIRSVGTACPRWVRFPHTPANLDIPKLKAFFSKGFFYLSIGVGDGVFFVDIFFSNLWWFY